MVIIVAITADIVDTTGATVKTVVHPGEILREDVFPALGISKAELARRLGVSRHSVYAILQCRMKVSPAMALRLERVVGGSADMWVRLQTAYDVERARKLYENRMAGLIKLRPFQSGP